MNATGRLVGTIQRLRRTAGVQAAAEAGDGVLLERFVGERDEAAFETLVRRHGAMVYGVCRRVLANDADAEDAFQATFLVLVRKAASVVPRSLVGNWLYGVALNTARKAKAMSGKRRARERQAGLARGTAGAAAESTGEMHAGDWEKLHALLDDELGRLPEKYRAVIVGCDLEGMKIREAARRLGWPQGTVAGRLARARVLLAKRLSQRGVVLSGGAIAVALAQAASAAAPLGLMDATCKAARLVMTGSALSAGVSTSVVALTEGVLKTMMLTKLKTISAAIAVAVLAIFTYGIMCGAPAATQTLTNTQQKGDTTKPAVIAMAGHQDDVVSVAFSLDGKHLASTSKDGTVHVWDTATGKKLADLAGHEGCVHAIAFAPDGKRIATAGEDATARLWAADTGKELHRLAHKDPVRALAFTSDGKTLLAAGGVYDSTTDEGRGELRRWEVESGKESVPFTQAFPRGFYYLLVSGDGATLITASGKSFTIWDWDGKDGLKERQTAHAEVSGFAYGLALSPDSKTLAVTWDAKIHLYDVATGKLRSTLEKSYVGVWGPLAFSHDGKSVAGAITMQKQAAGWIAQKGTMLRTWDAATGKVRHTRELPETVAAMAYAPDGGTFAVGCRGGVRFPDGKFIDFSRMEHEKDGSVKLLPVKEAPAGR